MTNKTSLFLILAMATILIAAPFATGTVFAVKNEDKNDNNPFQALQTQIDSFFDIFTELRTTDTNQQNQIDSFFDIFTELHATDANLQTQIDTISLTPGPQGDPGQDGISCWDLNSDGVGNISDEDLNGDGVVDVLDCRGLNGEQGSESFGLTCENQLAIANYVPTFTVSDECIEPPQDEPVSGIVGIWSLQPQVAAECSATGVLPLGTMTIEGISIQSIDPNTYQVVLQYHHSSISLPPAIFTMAAGPLPDFTIDGTSQYGTFSLVGTFSSNTEFSATLQSEITYSSALGTMSCGPVTSDVLGIKN